MTSSTDYSVGESLVSVRHLPVYFDQQGKQEAGLLNPASEVKVLQLKLMVGEKQRASDE